MEVPGSAGATQHRNLPSLQKLLHSGTSVKQHAGVLNHMTGENAVTVAIWKADNLSFVKPTSSSLKEDDEVGPGRLWSH